MTAPVLGIPIGEKQAGQRVDFKPTKFDLVIETKGYLLAWTRVILCPCQSESLQSQQPDPNCSLCNGSGKLYFGSTIAQDISAYTLTTLQQNIVTDSGALLIRGIITGITTEQNQLEKISNWVDGSLNLTVRAENKLGYMDRIVSLDTLITYTEVMEADGTDILEPRYPIVEVNLLRSKATIFVEGTDFEINSNGNIFWLGTPPVNKTLIAVHYNCYPTWLITSYPHVSRMTTKLFKIPAPMTPTGNPIDLPIQAMMKYEFLV